MDAAELVKQMLAIRMEVMVIALKLRMLRRLNPNAWWQDPEMTLDQAGYLLDEMAKSIERSSS